MEDYAAKMALKPDATLREYVAGYVQYQEAAVLAALDELRRRGQPAPEEATLRPLLEPAMQQARAAAAQIAATTQEDELPRLYSPAGIVVISATIALVAGAVLLAINMHRRKHGGAIFGLAALVVAYIIGEIFLLKWLVVHHLFSPLMPILADFPLIMAYVWWFWPRYVGTYQFQARNWLLPLAICFALKLAFAYTLLKNPEIKKEMAKQMQQMQQ